MFQMVNCGVAIQGGSQKLLLTTKESIVSSNIFPGPPCTNH